MPSKKSGKDKYGLLQGSAVIPVLYLLHYPDTAYNIAKTFEELRKKKKVKIPASLGYPAHIQPLLRPLVEAGLLNKEKIIDKDKPWLRKFVYRVNLRNIDPSLDYSVGSKFESSPWLIYTDIFNKVISKEKLVKLILSFKKYDYLTLLLYIRDGLYCLKHILLFYPIDVEAKNISNLVNESDFLGKIFDKNTVQNIKEFYEGFKKESLPIKTNSEIEKIFYELIDYVTKKGLSSPLLTMEKSDDIDLIQAQLTELSNWIIPFLDELILKESKKERGFLDYQMF